VRLGRQAFREHLGTPGDKSTTQQIDGGSQAFVPTTPLGPTPRAWSISMARRIT
jgi:hypothetical protein